MKADIAGPLTEGSTVVKGTAVAAGKPAPGVSLVLVDMGTLQPLSLRAGGALVSDAAGNFSADLAWPLVSGQKIQLWTAPFSPPVVAPAPVAASGAGTAKTPASGTSPAPVNPNDYTVFTVQGIADWGRVRATFAAGTVLSTENDFQGNASTQATLFLDFNVDKNWRWGGAVSTPTGTHINSHFLVDSFFETRLTSVPEAQTETTTAAASKTTTAATPGDSVTTLIGSRKSALVQGGLYFPYLVSNWDYRNTPYSLFIAPIAKVGFITPTDSSNPQSGSAQPVNNAQFYNYYGWGARIGHYKLSYDKGEAPELISYIDVITGRYSNLETITPFTDSSGKPGIRPIRQYRIGLEGALKVPSTPIVIGFSANIGQNLSGVPRTSAAKDDLRFFLGTKFDIGKVLAKLTQF